MYGANFMKDSKTLFLYNASENIQTLLRRLIELIIFTHIIKRL